MLKLDKDSSFLSDLHEEHIDDSEVNSHEWDADQGVYQTECSTVYIMWSHHPVP